MAEVILHLTKLDVALATGQIHGTEHVSLDVGINFRAPIAIIVFATSYD